MDSVQLYCHSAASKFALVKEGNDWRREFDSMDAAVVFARDGALRVTRVVMLDEKGEVTMERSLDELVS